MKREGAARVWFHRSRALAWAVVGALSFPLGWANSVALVWIASLYANMVSDWTAAEAADNRAVLDELRKLRAEQTALRTAVLGLAVSVREGRR